LVSLISKNTSSAVKELVLFLDARTGELLVESLRPAESPYAGVHIQQYRTGLEYHCLLGARIQHELALTGIIVEGVGSKCLDYDFPWISQILQLLAAALEGTDGRDEHLAALGQHWQANPAAISTPVRRWGLVATVEEWQTVKEEGSLGFSIQ